MTEADYPYKTCYFWTPMGSCEDMSRLLSGALHGVSFWQLEV